MTTYAGSLSQVKLPNGGIFEIKDAVARAAQRGGMVIRGVADDSPINDSSQSVNPISVDGTSTTFNADTNGHVVLYDTKQYVWIQPSTAVAGRWEEFGSVEGLGDLAFTSSAKGSFTYTPAGTVTAPGFTGTATTVKVAYTPAGTVTASTWSGSATTFKGAYTPAGTVTFNDGSDSVGLQQYATVHTDHVPAGITNDNKYYPTGSISHTITQGSITSTGTYTPTGSVTTASTTNKTATVTTASTSASASTTYKPQGSVSISTASQTVTASVAYTPGGTAAAPTISLATAGSTASIKGVNTINNLVSGLNNTQTGTFNYVGVSGQQLQFSYIGYTTAAAITTVGSTFKTGDGTYQASTSLVTGTPATITVTGTAKDTTAASFSGTPVRLVTGNIAVPNSFTFTGTSANISVAGTPNVGVTSTFTGDLTVFGYTDHIAHGATFSGTPATISVPITPAGTVGKPTFSGTSTTITITSTKA